MSVNIVKLLDTPVIINFGNIVPMGAYNPATTYTVGNSVSYLGNSYIAIQTTTGNLPTNTTYWQLLADGSGLTVSAPLQESLSNISIPEATVSVDGYLSATDWSTFNTAATKVSNATSSDTASSLVERDSSGNFSAGIITANITGNVSGSSSSFTGSLSGDVTGTQSATSITSSVVTGKLLTGYAVGADTPVAATDSVLGAFEKIQGQINTIGGSSVTSVTATSPLFSSGGSTPNITVQQATTSEDGYLSSTDWNTFNGKQAALSITNLTDAGTDGITITNGTGAVIGASPVTIAQAAASASQNGYLTSANFTTFNGKQAAGSYITALTGDGTASGPGSAALTLATVNSNVGPFGSSTSIPSFTVNAKGLITAASGNVVVAPAGTLSGTTLNSTVIGSSLTGVGTITSGVWNGTAIAIANGGTGQTTQTSAFDALSPLTTAGDTLYYDGTHNVRLVVGSTGQVLTVSGGIPAWVTPAAPGSGTVTSVALADISALPIYTITGSPVTNSGTLNFALDDQNQHSVFAGPVGGRSAEPTFRLLVSGDIPILNQNTTGTASDITTTTNSTLVTLSALSLPLTQTTGTLGISNGGTGNSSALTAGSVIFSNGTALTQNNANFFWDNTNIALRIGTNVPIGAGTETITLKSALASPLTGGAYFGLNSSLTISGNTTNTQSFIGSKISLVRAITATTSDTGSIGCIHTQLSFNVPSGSTYTNTNTGQQIASILAQPVTLTGTGTLAFDYAALLFTADSTAITGYKNLIQFGALSGGTNTAFISDNVTYSGNYFINQSGTAPSSFGGTIVLPTLTASLPLQLDASKNVVAAAISLTTAVSGVLPIATGGTGQTTPNAAFDALSPMTTVGDLVYENSTPTAARLPIGSTGNVLTVSGGVPVWAAPATSGTVTSVSVVSANGFTGTVATSTTTPAITLSTSITGILKGNGTAISAAIAGTDYVIPSGSITGTASNVTGVVAFSNGGTGQSALVSTKTSAYAITATNATVFVNTSGGAFTVTLPNPTTTTGQIFRIKDVGGALGTNQLTVAPFGTETIEGQASTIPVKLYANYGNYAFQSDGTNWWKVSASSNLASASFASSGSFIIPAGVTNITATGRGGTGGGSGGGGGGGGSTAAGAAGGGGGGSAPSAISTPVTLTVVPGATATITIGAAGTSGAGGAGAVANAAGATGTVGTIGGQGGNTTFAISGNTYTWVGTVEGFGGGGGSLSTIGAAAGSRPGLYGGNGAVSGAGGLTNAAGILPNNITQRNSPFAISGGNPAASTGGGSLGGGGGGAGAPSSGTDYLAGNVTLSIGGKGGNGGASGAAGISAASQASVVVNAGEGGIGGGGGGGGGSLASTGSAGGNGGAGSPGNPGNMIITWQE
jgi:hypothetical protein